MRLAGQTREDRPERPRVRMALVSPTIDKRRVTERRIAEEISHLADRCEFHLCCSWIEDIDLPEVVWRELRVCLPSVIIWWSSRALPKHTGQCMRSDALEPGRCCGV